MRLLLGFLLSVELAFSESSITPYTLIEISRQFDTAGNVKSESRFLFAVNREGSIASVDLDPAAGGARQILDFQRGQTIVVDPKAKSVSMFAYHPQQPGEPCEKRFRSNRNATVSVDHTADKVEGISVQRVSVSWENGRNMDVFMAPSLGCQMVKAVLQQNGRLIETRVVNDLRLGDPDPTLFQIPPEYRWTQYRWTPK